MKKILFYSMVSILTIPTLVGIVLLETKNNNSKIKFETNSLKKLALSSTDVNNNLIENSDTTQIRVKFNYDNFTYDSYEESNEKDIDQYKTSLFNAGCDYYYNNNLELFEEIDNDLMDNLYISKYSPFFTFECPTSQLNEVYDKCLTHLAELDCISHIRVKSSTEYIQKDNLSDAKNYRGVNVAQNLGYTGQNIKVGILETTILDASHSNFAGKNVTTCDDWWISETVSDHTTMMGSVIGGLYGVAPNCSLYSVQLTNDPIHEIDWLLDRGVDVINMSYGDANPTGYYDDDSAYMDFIVNTYGVSIIAAAGNEGNGTKYVANPGLGYNVFTLGAANNSSYSLSRLPLSSYLEESGPDKPNLLAPGLLSIPYFSTSAGTSHSAAFTTGCVALLMEAEPYFKLHPERVYSVLSANSDSLTSTSFSGLDSADGAGCINMEKVINNYDNMVAFTTTDTDHGSEEVTLYAESRDVIKVSAWWLAYADGVAENTCHTDFDITLYDDSYARVIRSNSGKNNNEFFQKVMTSSGFFTLCFYLAGQENVQYDKYSMAFAVEEN